MLGIIFWTASRSFFRSGNISGALDSYQRATAQYKLAGEWDKAAEVLSKMGDIMKKQGRKSTDADGSNEQTNYWQEIWVQRADCMAKLERASESFQQVVQLLPIWR